MNLSFAEVTVGLTEILVEVDEDVGVREVCAVVTDGDLEQPVIVTLNLNPRTAIGNYYDYCACKSSTKHEICI